VSGLFFFIFAVQASVGELISDGAY
jgi:hypothetical protein